MSATKLTYTLPDGSHNTIVCEGPERIKAKELALLLDIWADERDKDEAREANGQSR